MRHLSRKYTDLIYEGERKYGTWDPSIPVTLGDYGTFDIDSGAFDVQGNIFEGDFSVRHANALHALGKPFVAPPEPNRAITSAGVKQLNASEEAVLSLGPANLSQKWAFSFGRHVGAVLVLAQPTITKFPREGNLKALLTLLEAELPGKVLATAVVNAPAYALIVSRGRDSSASIGLKASTSAVPGVTAGGGGDASWVRNSTSGVWKVGSLGSLEGGRTYNPMLELSVLKPRWWSSGLGNAPVTQRMGKSDKPEDDFLPFLPPWGPLDDDGEEIEDVEPDFDEDFDEEDEK